ncbi:MAG: ROK family protein [Bryobacterales bacterium]|nr:ROK family protein [Bryobacterales bacterium]
MEDCYGGLEAGGTKFVCAVGTGPSDLRERTEFPTTSPEETIRAAVAFFNACSRAGKLTAIGIGSFGPIDLHPGSPTFGYITSTPKEGWRNIDIAGAIRKGAGVSRVAFDTDVNAAALGEARWGAARGLDTFLYLTIGTGIGGGGMVNGRLLHGLLHPEMGHMRVPHDRQVDPFAGCCPWHGDCLEGLASGEAMRQRWGMAGQQIPPDHAAWRLEVQYLAHALVNLICSMSPRRLVLGGGVMQGLSLPALHAAVRGLLNGYLQVAAILDRIEDYIVRPQLGADAGVLGAIALAQSTGGLHLSTGAGPR